jgi:MraZ protein
VGEILTSPQGGLCFIRFRILGMAFTGLCVRILDDTSRLAVPKGFRDAFGTDADSTLVLAPEVDRALALFSMEQFQRRADENRRQPDHGQEIRTYQRMYCSQAESVDLGRQGRIPDRLMAFAGLQQEVALLGVNDHVEIWDKLHWENFLKNHGDSFDQVALQF